jgi:hypothetical protein
MFRENKSTLDGFEDIIMINFFFITNFIVL